MKVENDELLLKANAFTAGFKNIKIENGKVIFINTNEQFDGRSIKKLLSFVNMLNIKYPRVKMPIVIKIGNIVFKDKLTYVFLEIICYLLIKKYGHLVQVIFRCKHNILIEGIASSPLLLLNCLERDNMMKFLEKFDDELYKNHYRKIMRKKEDTAELSKKMDEISYFLKFSGVEEECIDELSEVIVELIGNAWEHASSECLVDIDVTNSYFKEKSVEPFLGVNIAVLNFSNDLLGDSVRRKILEDQIELPERYNLVKKSYANHANYFDDNYKETDFFNIASFQHKISGRKNKTATGGTGLTKLISSLEKRSDAHHCYLITGDRALWFRHQYLEYDEDGWIGFNESNNFIEDIPAHNTLCPNSIYMPGTAYNLNFVMKRRKEKWIM